MTIAGLVLAGGAAQRFAGGAKEDALLRGKPLLDHVIDRAAPQVSSLALSRARKATPIDHGLPVIADIYAGCGPLGGIHAGLLWASSLSPAAERLAVFACDTPLIAESLVQRLDKEMTRSGARAVVPAHDGRAHPTLGLWSVNLAPLAEQRLKDSRLSLHGFAEAAGARLVDLSDFGDAAFFNVNAAADLAALEALLCAGG